MTPVEAFKASPAGSAPPMIAQVIGALPETSSVCKYGAFTRAAGNGEVVAIEGGAFTVRLNCLELLPKALVARTLKMSPVIAAGVPLMAPVDLFKVRPAESE